MQKVVIISGSKADQEWVEQIQAELTQLNIQSEWEACSAHKETKRLIELQNNGKALAMIWCMLL